MIQLVKVAKIKEGDIKHKYVCDGGIIDPPITDHRMAIFGQLECHVNLTNGFSCLFFLVYFNQ